MRKRFLMSLAAIFIISGLNAEESQVFIRGVRPLGMGGAFTAIADDQNAPFYNPAGLMQRTSSLLTIFEIPVTIGQDLYELHKYWEDNGDDLEDFDTLDSQRQADLINEITDKIGKLNPYVGIGFPNTGYFSKPDKMAWGLGLYGQAGANIAIRTGILVPNITVLGNIDTAAIFPLAYKFDAIDIPYWKGSVYTLENLSLGVNLKYLMRMNISEVRKSVLELEEWDPILQKGSGFGMDLGALYPVTSRLTAGLMVSDFLGTKISYKTETNDAGEIRQAKDTVIPPAVNFGLSYVPNIPLPFIKDRLLLAADIRDIFDAEQKVFDKTIYTKLHFGAEYRLTFLRARVGFNQGYPTIGLGANIFALKLDYAYYTDELGKYAGQDPYGKHVICVGLRFGAGGGKNTLEQAKVPNDTISAADMPGTDSARLAAE